MPDTMTEAERAAIRAELQAQRGDLWIKTSSESDHPRNQVYFWFLVQDRDHVAKAMDLVASMLKKKY